VKPIDIQFASRAGDKRIFHIGCLALGALALAASLWEAAMTEAASNQAEAQYRDAVSKAERRAREPAPTRAFSLPPAQIRAVNAAIDKLNLPWGQLFAVLEHTKPDHVALLSIEPDGKKRSLHISAESKTYAEMLDFVERFRQAAPFEDAFLTKHEIRDQDPNRPYRFSVELRWSKDRQADVAP
jgi:hypothetical protein